MVKEFKLAKLKQFVLQIFPFIVFLFGASISNYGLTIYNKYDDVTPLSLDSNYSGFGFAHNFTQTLNVEIFHLVHFIESPYLRSEIRFYFDYLVRENGTYMVAFLLPFKIYTQLTSELNYTVTEIGSIV